MANLPRLALVASLRTSSRLVGGLLPRGERGKLSSFVHLMHLLWGGNQNVGFGITHQDTASGLTWVQECRRGLTAGDGGHRAGEEASSLNWVGRNVLRGARESNIRVLVKTHWV